MSHEKIVTDKVFKHPAPVSQGTLTRSALLHISGQVAQGPDGKTVGVGDIVKQTERTLENLKAIVEQAGGSMKDVCRIVIYLLKREDLAKVIEVRRRNFSEPYPAVSAIIVAGLANPEWLIEIEATAAIG